MRSLRGECSLRPIKASPEKDPEVEPLIAAAPRRRPSIWTGTSFPRGCSLPRGRRRAALTTPIWCALNHLGKKHACFVFPLVSHLLALLHSFREHGSASPRVPGPREHTSVRALSACRCRSRFSPGASIACTWGVSAWEPHPGVHTRAHLSPSSSPGFCVSRVEKKLPSRGVPTLSLSDRPPAPLSFSPFPPPPSPSLPSPLRLSPPSPPPQATLLSSPFLLFANALSPITPSRALLAQGVSDAQAAALTAFPARSPAPLCFSSPNHSRRFDPSPSRPPWTAHVRAGPPPQPACAPQASQRWVVASFSTLQCRSFASRHPTSQPTPGVSPPAPLPVSPVPIPKRSRAPAASGRPAHLLSPHHVYPPQPQTRRVGFVHSSRGFISWQEKKGSLPNHNTLFAPAGLGLG